MEFLVVTAVGRLLRCWRMESVKANLMCLGGCVGVSSPFRDIVSGKMMVPSPRGFSTFLILMGMRARMTCSIVKGWMTSEP